MPKKKFFDSKTLFVLPEWDPEFHSLGEEQ
jgi:hypothetical protein